MNPFGVEALIAAYNEGEEWLEELKSYLFANYQYVKNYFNEHLPDFPVLKLEGTYLVWVDCSVSVSYTHLDVYKRQHYLCALLPRQLLFICSFLGWVPSKNAFSTYTAIAVSYTHLLSP